jgi:hypothetical protein
MFTPTQAAIVKAAIELTFIEYPAVSAHVQSGRGGMLRIDPDCGGTAAWIIWAGYWNDAITPELLLEYSEIARDDQYALPQRLWRESRAI